MKKKYSSRPSSIYFTNALVDYAVIGLASILIYFLLRYFHDGARSSRVMELAALLMWLVNWPHFSATNFRLYRSYRNMCQYPMTSFVIPFVILGGMVGSCLFPETMAPFFVKLFLLWSPYHFSGQSLGISLVYARRSGFTLNSWGRFGLSGFIFGTFITSTAKSETGLGDSDFYGIAVPILGLPVEAVMIAQVLMWGCGILFLLFVLRQFWLTKKIVPGIVLLPAVTQYIWFVQGSGWASFQEFVPLFHSLQYLLIAWVVQLSEKLGELKTNTTSLTWQSFRWFGLNFVGGALLFYGLPRLLSLLGVPFALAMGVTLAGVQIHHFFVDGVIWKIKNEKVSSPLMVNIAELKGSLSVRGQ